MIEVWNRNGKGKLRQLAIHSTIKMTPYFAKYGRYPRAKDVPEDLRQSVPLPDDACYNYGEKRGE